MIPDRPLRILHVNTTEAGGGAAFVAASLSRGCRSRGCESWLAVGRSSDEDRNVFVVPQDNGEGVRAGGYTALQKRLARLAKRNPGAGWGALGRGLRRATHPRALQDWWQGREDFEFSGTYQLLDLCPERPDIVHCHNLHGGYFDLRALAWLSQQVPTVLTLHDAWLLSGHCAHSLDCDRWATGCGACPDLTIDPPIRRDATSENWLRKRDIYANCRLHIASPCEWLMRKVERSILAPAVASARVIPNGVDCAVFKPADRAATRSALGLPLDATVILANRGGARTWNDDRMLDAALEAIASRMGQRRLVCVSLGASGSSRALAGVMLRDDDYQRDPAAVSRYLQAADLYLHAARADTFPASVIEALACGTPVVASAVGGIPEQIVSATDLRGSAASRSSDATGMLVPAGDALAMADAAMALVDDPSARRALGENGVRAARTRFDVNQQVACYVEWYSTIIERSRDRAATHV